MGTKRPVSGQAIAKGIADHKGLQDLTLSSNGFGDVGAEAWSAQVRGFRALR